MRIGAALTTGLLLFWGAAAPAGAEVERWSVIRDQSSIAMSVRALGMRHAGEFASWTSSDIRFDPGAPERAQATIDVRAGSLSMRERGLTQRAVGPDFLDAEHYPTIRFRLRSVARDDRSSQLTARADATIKGRTRPVSFPLAVTHLGDVDRMTGGFVLDRTTYGVGSSGGLNSLIGRDVRIDVVLTLRRTAP
ncbi:hypothetical protein BH10PSE1_BH10PSE1_08380 [soil metagenome]